jgi:protein-tyrosine-phosphatase
MKVLFICKNNQFRSQMAASLYNKITNTNDAYSAGTYVGSDAVPENSAIEKYFSTPHFFELMEENGMNIRNNHTKKLLPEMIKNSDIVISIVQDPFVPDFLRNSKKVMWWDVEDPKFATREVSEKTYNQIKGLIENLLREQQHSF